MKVDFDCNVSGDMISTAQVCFANSPYAQLCVVAELPETSPYGTASGIFNLRFAYSENEWREYPEITLDVLDRTSRLGFAFNSMTLIRTQTGCGTTSTPLIPESCLIFAGDFTRAMWHCSTTLAFTNSDSGENIFMNTVPLISGLSAMPFR